MMRKRGSRGILIAALLALGGCKFQGLVSRHPDWLVVAEVARYFDLSVQEAGALQPGVAVLLKNMVRDIGPGVSALSTEIEQAIDKGNLTVDLFDGWILKGGEWRRTFAERLTAPVTEFLLGLDKDQVAYFRGQLKKNNKPLDRLLKTSAKKWAERSGAYALGQVESLAFWLGPLTSEQREAFIADLEIDRRFVAKQVEERTFSQKNWDKLLRTKDRASLGPPLKRWILGESADGSGAREENRLRWRKAVFHLLVNLMPEQKKVFISRLAELRSHLEMWGKLGG
jgi:hypothetical protein